MHITISIAASLVLLGARAQDPTAPQDGARVEIRFQPTAGSALERAWQSEHDLMSESMLTALGEELAAVPGRMRVRSRHVLTVVDHFRAIAEGRPTDLRRTFGEVRRDSKQGLLEMEGVEPTPPMQQGPAFLPQTSVVFLWSPADGTYGKHYDAAESDEAYLAGLSEDLDLRALLPGGPVAVGESWSVAPPALCNLFAPGGAIPYELPRKANPRLLRTLASGIGSELENVFGGAHGGEMTVTLREVRETEGRREAVLALAADFKISNDQVERVQAQLAPAERAAGMVIRLATIVVELQGGGELVWDLDGGFARSLTMDLSERVHQRLEHEIEGQDDRPPSTQELRMAGKLTIMMSAKPVEPPPVPGPR